MESQEPNVAATATGVPSTGVVTAGKAGGSWWKSIMIDLEIIYAIVRDIRDPDLAAMVLEFATPYVNITPPESDTIAAIRATKVMNFEAGMIILFSREKAIAEKKSLGNPKLPAPIKMRLCVKTGSPYLVCVMFGLAEDSTEGSTVKLDVENAFAALVECASDDEKEIVDRTIDLFSSVKETIERAKAAAIEETVAAAAPEGKIPEKFHDLIRTIVSKLRDENSLARAYFALSVFVKIIMRQTMAPIVEMRQNM